MIPTPQSGRMLLFDAFPQVSSGDAMGRRQGTSLGETHNVFLGVGNKEFSGWPFLLTTSRFSSMWLWVLCVLVASLGWGKWNAGSLPSWLLVVHPRRDQLTELRDCKLPEHQELCRALLLRRISHVVAAAAATEEQVTSLAKMNFPWHCR